MIISISFLSCHNAKKKKDSNISINSNISSGNYSPKPSDFVISRTAYLDKLYGFWLGECIANWTGLVTEMDKVGNIGEFQTGAFYTRDDWGKVDQPSIWGQGIPSDLSPTIDFVFRDEGDMWGSDDDTDIEYIYIKTYYLPIKRPC